MCGQAVATHPSDRERTEWPPHPDRIFMALAAAHFETGADPTEREALLWIEALKPPAFRVSDHETRTGGTCYVPVNDAASPRLRPGQVLSDSQLKDGLGLLPENRLRQPRKFTVAIPHDPIVHLIWVEEIPSDVRESLESLCRKVTYVGHSTSLVQMWLEASPPEANLLPSPTPDARYRLRIPNAGRLAELERRFNADGWAKYRQLRQKIAGTKGKQQKDFKADFDESFGDSEPTFFRPIPTMWRGYERSQIAHDREKDLIGTCFARTPLILRRVQGPPLGLQSTLQLTKSLHRALIAVCPVQPPPEWLSGHSASGEPTTQDHLGFFPLAHFGHEHADGHLLGLALAIPHGVSADEQTHCWRGVLYDEFGLSQLLPRLRLGSLGTWDLELAEGGGQALALRPETWTAAGEGARRWATITPIALDKHPRGANQWRQIEQTIVRACQRVGLPEPADVILSPVSLFEGAPHARAFPCIQRKSGGSIYHTHAIITFPKAVCGPMLLGAGRYRGYGLCRPLLHNQTG